MAICNVDGCRRKHSARGLCATHYKQAQRDGSFTDLPKAAQLAADKLAAPVPQYLDSDDYRSQVAACRVNWERVKFAGKAAEVEAKRTVLAHMEILHFWMMACTMAKVPRLLYLEWVESDELFAMAVVEAAEAAVQRAEYRMFEAAMRPDSKGDTNTQALIMFLNKYADWNPASRALDEMRNAKLIDDIARTLREALPTETADALIQRFTKQAARARRLPAGASLK